MAETKNKFSRRTIALFWLLLVAVVIGVICILNKLQYFTFWQL
jgi:cytochrome b561